tara:strand:+ start:1231 stop:1530 length:300 start_codon:yes stop_codon:yes gene_type:complete
VDRDTRVPFSVNYWHLAAVGIALSIVLWTGTASTAWAIGVFLLGTLPAYAMRLARRRLPRRLLSAIGRWAAWVGLGLGLALALLLLVDALWSRLAHAPF